MNVCIFKLVMHIYKVRYKSTNCYFIDTGNGILAFDAGWPGTYGTYKDLIKAEGHTIKEVKWLIVSHFHMDHAGLAGTLVRNGIQFIVFDNQLHAIGEMENLIESKGFNYTRIDLSRTVKKGLSDSRRWLESIGIMGEVIKTDGHGEQSISLLLDSGEAFIGDLIPHEDIIGADDYLSKRNWEELKMKGAKRIMPAHDEEYCI